MSGPVDEPLLAHGHALHVVLGCALRLRPRLEELQGEVGASVAIRSDAHAPGRVASLAEARVHALDPDHGRRLEIGQAVVGASVDVLPAVRSRLQDQEVRPLRGVLRRGPDQAVATRRQALRGRPGRPRVLGADHHVHRHPGRLLETEADDRRVAETVAVRADGGQQGPVAGEGKRAARDPQAVETRAFDRLGRWRV